MYSIYINVLKNTFEMHIMHFIDFFSSNFRGGGGQASRFVEGAPKVSQMKEGGAANIGSPNLASAKPFPSNDF